MRPTTQFRRLLNQPGIIMAPGAYDCLTAKLIETAGFPAVYMTGAGTSVARLGYPDLALATMTEMRDNAAAIAAIVEIPVIADADTGYGGILNVRRTILQYERSGVAALHLEDQEAPKRCGHQPLLSLPCQRTAKESSENVATLYLTAGLCKTTPTENIPEAPELGTPRYHRQNVGSQWCQL